jgi:hypothetical protein
MGDGTSQHGTDDGKLQSPCDAANRIVVTTTLVIRKGNELARDEPFVRLIRTNRSGA